MDIQIHEMGALGQVQGGVGVNGISPSICADRAADGTMHTLDCIGTTPHRKSGADYQRFYMQYKCIHCDNRWITKCVAVDGMRILKVVPQIGG